MLSTKKVEEAPKEEKLTLVPNCGNPDGISIPFSDCYINSDWNSSYTYAFIYNKELDDIIWNTEPSRSHNYLVDTHNEYIANELTQR